MEWKEFCVFFEERKNEVGNNSLHTFVFHKYAAEQKNWICGTEDLWIFLFKFRLELFTSNRVKWQKMSECDDDRDKFGKYLRNWFLLTEKQKSVELSNLTTRGKNLSKQMLLLLWRRLTSKWKDGDIRQQLLLLLLLPHQTCVSLISLIIWPAFWRAWNGKKDAWKKKHQNFR